MGQNTAGTSLKTTAVAQGAKCCFRLLCDWDDTGFANHASWTDESAYVLSINGSMEAVGFNKSLSAVGSGVTNQCTVVLSNPATAGHRRFSITDPSSALYAKIGEGAIRMKRAILEMGYYNGASPEYLHQITGYIVGFEELAHSQEVQFQIRDRGADLTMTRGKTSLYTNVMPGPYIDTLTGLMSRDQLAADGGYGSQIVDTGTFPLYYAWSDDEQIYEEMTTVAESQMGWVFFDKDGDFHFHDGAHWVKAQSNAWDDPTQSQHTFTDDHYESCQPGWEFREQYTHVLISYVPRYLGTLQDVYSSPEPFVIPPGETKTVIAEFKYPAYGVVNPPVNEQDYTIVTSGGTDLSSSTTITMTVYGQSAKLAVTNNHATYTAFLCGLTLRGYPALPRQRLEYEASGAGADHANSWRVKNPYIQSYRQAEAIGDFVIARYGDPLGVVALKGCVGLPWLEIGDRIVVDSTSVNASKRDFFIVRLKYNYGPPQYAYTMDISGIRVDDLFPIGDYAVIATSKYGTGTRHGHLFW